MTRPTINRGHKALIFIVIIGVIAIAGIGFAGSYKAVWALADQEGFGWFARWLPIGVDAGIVVLYAFELLLTWLRMPFPLLRQTAWVLTVATIVMNSATAWGRPLAMGMHAVVPVLFIIVVEAARHAVARWASLAAGKPMREGFTLGRWANSPFGTFAMWRRKHIWGINSNEELIGLEKRRKILIRLLKKKYGWRWRKQASELAQLLLSMSQFGEGDPRLYDDALAELGVSLRPREVESAHRAPLAEAHQVDMIQPVAIPQSRPAVGAGPSHSGHGSTSSESAIETPELGLDALDVEVETALPGIYPQPNPVEFAPTVTAADNPVAEAPEPDALPAAQPAATAVVGAPARPVAVHAEAQPEPLEDLPAPDAAYDPIGSTEVNLSTARARVLYGYYVAFVERWGNHPTKEQFVQWAFDEYGEVGQDNGPLKTESVKRYWKELTDAYRNQYETPQSDLLQMASAGS